MAMVCFSEPLRLENWRVRGYGWFGSCRAAVDYKGKLQVRAVSLAGGLRLD